MFVLALTLALAIAVFVTTRLWNDVPPHTHFERLATPAAARGDWFATHKAHCNAVEVSSFLATNPAPGGAIGMAQRVACLAFAGRIGVARDLIAGLPVHERDIAVNYVFAAAHPIADAGDNHSTGQIMELVLQFQPDQYMALYHAGMAQVLSGDAETARDHLNRFLAIYRANDGWRQNARNALAELGTPAGSTAVQLGVDRTLVY